MSKTKRERSQELIRFVPVRALVEILRIAVFIVSGNMHTSRQLESALPPLLRFPNRPFIGRFRSLMLVGTMLKLRIIMAAQLDTSSSRAKASGPSFCLHIC
ncbi:unnamed protein product [Cuscuta epithymum]|uniref:Uncharacterized protein n=1 Tax=Cuscuta epithymum TaxID=186058 RepID=A0AAV0DK70_9ASTE|nr:unnamed protein product [Cuscuta epithymum]